MGRPRDCRVPDGVFGDLFLGCTHKSGAPIAMNRQSQAAQETQWSGRTIPPLLFDHSAMELPLTGHVRF